MCPEHLKINLLDFDRTSMRELFVQLGEKAFHADQVFQWIHTYGHQDFEGMTNLSRSLRQYLTEQAQILSPQIAQEKVSKDGTRKWLLRLSEEAFVEMVFIPETSRGTLCVSSQVGCPMQCCFCATGHLGFTRNLTVAEIVGQVWLAVRQLSTSNKEHDRKVTNVVFMGMGEPLLNLEHVIKACHVLTDPFGYGLSKYRVTISTCGIVPQIDQLSEESDVSLAISLHAPNDALRDQLMPINKKYPIAMLMDACRRFLEKDSKRQLSIEYIMIDGINDKPEHVKQLIRLLRGIACKVNLIPFNAVTFSNCHYHGSASDVVEAFGGALLNAGFRTMIRKQRGADIEAACGQLAGGVKS
jgi:23S rRNA (adenine2503-C2)-methyltransferase